MPAKQPEGERRQRLRDLIPSDEPPARADAGRYSHIELAALGEKLESTLAVLEATISSITEMKATAPTLDELEQMVERVTARAEHAPNGSNGQGHEAVDERYLLLMPSTGGYVLRAEQGDRPRPGSEVDLGGEGRFRLMRYGPSPLPGDGRRCAYLERL